MAANDIDKGLSQAPQGLTEKDLASMLGEPDLEIEIEDPEEVSIKMGGLEIEIDPDEMDDGFNDNLAEEMDDNLLQNLASDLIEEYEGDLSARRDWLDTYVDGLELLGLKIEDRSEPWEGACNVFHPILTETLVKFQAETMTETFPAAGPVKTQIIGAMTQEKDDAAKRVQEDMNYQLTQKMTEYRPEHERMLWGLGLAGNAFKKVYFDPSLDRQVSMYIPAEDLVVPYGASSLETAERVTHVMRKTKNELRKLQVAGFYRDEDLGEPSHNLEEVEKKIAEKMGFNATTDNRFKVLEMHVDLDLEGYEDEEDGKPTGIALPYVVTIERSTQTILAIRRNWDPEDDTKQKRQHFVHYGYVPGFGFYHFGLIHLIGAFAKSGTMLLRQLVDAGTLSNLPGGFKSRGLRIKGDETPIAPAEFRDVDVPSGTIRDNIMALPYKEPSQVLNLLMNQIIDEGRRFASAADLKVSDMSANAPVGTTLAILERTLKVMSAVQARIHYAMKQEFKLLKGIIRDYTSPDYSYTPVDGDAAVKKEDYDMVEVIPVSDPNAATMSQKVVQYQAVMQLAQQNPDLYDMVALNRQMLEVLGVKNIDTLLPDKNNVAPADPVTENMNILNQKPVQAFIYQDHEAHLITHMSFRDDPKIREMVGQNPQAGAMLSAMEAHIAEHLAFEYKKQMEEQLGVPLPNVNEENPIPEEYEVEISRLASEAAKKLLQKDMAEAQQQQAEQQAQDPLIQMQQKELQLKEMEIQTKAQKTMADIELDKARIEVDRMRIESQEKIAGAELGARAAMEKQKLDAEELRQGTRLGIEAVMQEKKLETDLAKTTISKQRKD
jgi:hypothetical protein